MSIGIENKRMQESPRLFRRIPGKQGSEHVISNLVQGRRIDYKIQLFYSLHCKVLKFDGKLDFRALQDEAVNERNKIYQSDR